MSDLDGLAALLRDKTFDGKLKWQLVADNRISIKQGNHIIDVYKGGGFFEIILRNTNGVVLSNEHYSSLSSVCKTLDELFDKARRDALGIDEAINDVKQRLLHL